MDKITIEELQKTYTDLRSHLADTTIEVIHGLVSSLYNSAIEFGKIKENPNKKAVVAKGIIDAEGNPIGK